MRLGPDSILFWWQVWHLFCWASASILLLLNDELHFVSTYCRSEAANRDARYRCSPSRTVIFSLNPTHLCCIISYPVPMSLMLRRLIGAYDMESFVMDRNVMDSDILSIFPSIYSIFPGFLHPILPLITAFGNSLSIFGSGNESTHGSLLGEITCDTFFSI